MDNDLQSFATFSDLSSYSTTAEVNAFLNTFVLLDDNTLNDIGITYATKTQVTQQLQSLQNEQDGVYVAVVWQRIELYSLCYRFSNNCLVVVSILCRGSSSI